MNSTLLLLGFSPIFLSLTFEILGLGTISVTYLLNLLLTFLLLPTCPYT